MRLLRIDIEEFRSIENQWLPADGLVVLFGPNSAGKTTLIVDTLVVDEVAELGGGRPGRLPVDHAMTIAT